MQAARLLATQLNALNFHLHEVAASMEHDEWLRRAVPGTNLPAFTLWHVPRTIDSTVNMGIRGVPELIASEPWVGKPWARPEGGTGYSAEEADQLAAEVVPEEVAAYADAVRSNVSQWLKSVTDEDLEAPNKLKEHVAAARAYQRPEVQESILPLVGQPVWIVVSIACYAHGWAHLEEIKLLAAAGRR